MNPSDYRDRQKNFISAASERLKAKFGAQRKADAFMLLVESIVNDVLALARPIQQAGGAVKPDDQAALKEHIMVWTMERLQAVDKENLRLIAGVHLAQRILEAIESDPWGKGGPEQLS